MRNWELAEWREVLFMIMYFRHRIQTLPLPDDDPERLRRLASMSKDVAATISDLLNEEPDGDEEDLSYGSSL